MKKYFAFLIVMFGVLFSAVADDKKTSGFLYSNYTSEYSDSYVGSFVVKNNNSQQFYNGISAKLQSSLSSAFGSESLKNWVRHSLIKGEVSEYHIPDFMQIGGNYVSDFVTSKLTHNIEHLSYVHDVNIDIKTSLGDRKWEVALDSIGAVRDTDDDIILWNARGFVAQNDTGGGSAGLIYRRNFNQVLLGVNSYLDFENDGDYGSFWRYSSGIEAMGNSWDFSANVYRAITGDKTAIKSGVLSTAYSADGWDAQVNGNLPFYPQLAIGARYYKWQQKFDKDISGLVYSAELNPTNNFRVGVEYDDRQSTKGEWGVYAYYKILFGDKKESLSASSFVAQNIDVWERRYETPTRRYAQQIVNNVESAGNSSNGVIITRPFVLQTNVLSVAVDSPLLANLTPESIANVYADYSAIVNLEFTNPALITSVISTGIVILIPPNSKAINGIFRVVVSTPLTIGNNERLIVPTRQAVISEIISDGAFRVDIDIQPTSTSNSPLLNSVRSISRGSPVLSQTAETSLIRNRCGSGILSYQTPLTLKPAAGCAGVRYNYILDFDYNDNQGTDIISTISITGNFAIGIEGQTVIVTNDIHTMNFRQIRLQASFIPLYFTPYVNAGYNVSLGGQGALGIEVSYNNEILVTVRGLRRSQFLSIPTYQTFDGGIAGPGEFQFLPIVLVSADINGKAYVGSGIIFNLLLPNTNLAVLNGGVRIGPALTATIQIDGLDITCDYNIENQLSFVSSIPILRGAPNIKVLDTQELARGNCNRLTTPPATSTVSQDDLIGGSGDVRVNLRWADDNIDLDLHVIDPCGTRIQYINRRSLCQGLTGRLDVDNVDFGATFPPGQVTENITWTSGAPRGKYMVEVDHFNPTHAASDYIVDIFYGGNHIRERGRIGPGDPNAKIFEFDF